MAKAANEERYPNIPAPDVARTEPLDPEGPDRGDAAADLPERLRALRDVLLSGLVERDVAIRLALLATLAGEHLLLLGPPGTAKSLVARRLDLAMDGSTYFERLLTRFTRGRGASGSPTRCALTRPCSPGCAPRPSATRRGVPGTPTATFSTRGASVRAPGRRSPTSSATSAR